MKKWINVTVSVGFLIGLTLTTYRTADNALAVQETDPSITTAVGETTEGATTTETTARRTATTGTATAKTADAKKQTDTKSDSSERVMHMLYREISVGSLKESKEEQDKKKKQEEEAKKKQEEEQKTMETSAQQHRTDLIANEDAALASGQYPVMGESSITAEQMAAYYNAYSGNYPSDALAPGGAPDIQTFAQIFCDEASAEGVRPEVAFAQTMKETGWLKFGGDATISQYNFAGLGVTGGGVAGNSYPDVRTGVRAQIQHLKAYATSEPLSGACVDNRYDYVNKGCAPYVEWLGQQENPQGAGWATGAGYGPDIVNMIREMRTY